MKVNKHVIAERRDFMKSLIVKDPKMSGTKLNAEFKKKFGTQLRINTVYDLKEECGFDRNGNRQGDKAAPMTVAERGPGAPLKAFPMLVQMGAGDNPVGFAERVLGQLKAAGVVNLKVTGRGDTWVVIEPDA